MAVAAFEIDDRAGGAAPDGLHMDGVIKFYRAEIAPTIASVCAQRSEFRVALFKTADVPCVFRRAF